MNESLTPTSTNIQDEEAFPSFEDCPHENDIPFTYYRERGGVYYPIRHWCFLGEITHRLVFNRLCLTVKDRTGKTITVSFYLNPHTLGEMPVHPNIPKALTKKGNTIAILYPEQHNFMDGTIGFRIEDATRVQVRPIPLDGILLLVNDRPT